MGPNQMRLRPWDDASGASLEEQTSGGRKAAFERIG
jgi:hypothetical protein